MKFKSDIEVQAGLKDSSGAIGTSGQLLSSTGTRVSWTSLNGFVPYTGAIQNVDLGIYTLLAAKGVFSSSGSANTVEIGHSSGSGIALNITKGGNGEGLYINKTSGSGNAVTIIGTLNATTLVKSGGTATQFLKADGTVDSTTYVPASRTITINGVTQSLAANQTWTVSGGVSGSGAVGQVAYWDGTTSITGESNLFWDSTNDRLGIGTASPSFPLHLYKASSDVLLALQKGFNFGYVVNDGTNIGLGSNLGSTGYKFLVNRSAPDNAMIINSSGNVGIGTTSPQAKLHSNSDILTGYFQNGTNGIYDALKLTNNTASNTLSGNGARIQFYNNANNSTNLLGASIRSVNVDYGWASDLVLSSIQNNGYASQTVNDSVWIKANGNVGIGTTSPTSVLHIAGGSYPAINIQGGATGGGGFRMLSGASGSDIYAELFGEYESSNNGMMLFRTRGSGTLTERMRITSGGNVGIGTTSPSSILHVNAGASFDTNIRVQSGAAGNHAKLTFSNSSNSVFWTVGYRSGTGDFGINYGDSFNSTGLTINTSGNVGIGTTSPSSRLHVENGNILTRSAALSTSIIAQSNQNTDYKAELVCNWDNNCLLLRAGKDYKVLETEGFSMPDTLKLFTSNTERMRITASGNVLIGTTTDSGYKLDVNGNSAFRDTLRLLSGSTNTVNLSWTGSNTGLINLFNAGSLTTQILASGPSFFGGTVTATGFFQSSDERLKDIISRNGDVITYKWKDGRDDKNHVGYSAQEVQKIMPDAVNESEDGMLSVNYIEVLVAKIAKLESRIKELEK